MLYCDTKSWRFMKNNNIVCNVYITKSFEKDENINIYVGLFLKPHILSDFVSFNSLFISKKFLFLATICINYQVGNLNKNSYHSWVAARFRISDP